MHFHSCPGLLGYHSKIPQTGWLKQQKCVLSQAWSLEGRGQLPAGLVLGEGRLPGLQVVWPPPASPHRCRESSCPSPPYKGTNPAWSPHSRPRPVPEAPLQTLSHWDLDFSTRIWGMGDKSSVHSNLIKNRQMQVFLSRRCLDEQSPQRRHIMSEMRVVRNENLKHNKRFPFNFCCESETALYTSTQNKTQDELPSSTTKKANTCY